MGGPSFCDHADAYKIHVSISPFRRVIHTAVWSRTSCVVGVTGAASLLPSANDSIKTDCVVNYSEAKEGRTEGQKAEDQADCEKRYCVQKCFCNAHQPVV